jgi:thiol-disulfide isomerase/thioredoxin
MRRFAAFAAVMAVMAVRVGCDRVSRRSMAATLLGIALLLLPAQALARGDWNDAGIDWRTYEEALVEAKKSGKPICLVFYTDWCGHCTNYSRVFHDARVIEKAKAFVMVRVNDEKDENRELSGEYAPDGQYIPRTYFLSKDGALDPGIHAPRAKHMYFYSEHKPESLLAGMDAALAKHQ